MGVHDPEAMTGERNRIKKVKSKRHLFFICSPIVNAK
jgi:hypothetical protein